MKKFIYTEGQYNLRTNEILKTVKTAIASAPREFWRCEPSLHIEGTKVLRN